MVVFLLILPSTSQFIADVLQRHAKMPWLVVPCASLIPPRHQTFWAGPESAIKIRRKAELDIPAGFAGEFGAEFGADLGELGAEAGFRVGESGTGLSATTLACSQSDRMP